MNDTRRKRFLTVSLKLLLLIGGLMLGYPFIASLNVDVDSPPETRAGVEVDLSTLAVGHVRQLKLGARPIWVLHRSPEEIAYLPSNRANLRDADSGQSQQFEAVRNPYRSLAPEFFVVIPLETVRQCQVSWSEGDAGGPGEFSEPCYGARFDSAGRIYKGSGVPEQRNLTVPEYEWLSDFRIRLLPPS